MNQHFGDENRIYSLKYNIVNQKNKFIEVSGQQARGWTGGETEKGRWPIKVIRKPNGRIRSYILKATRGQRGKNGSKRS